MTICVIFLISGCATRTNTKVVNTTCLTDWRIKTHKKDYFTRGTAEQLVEKNCLWENMCVDKSKMNPKCPTVPEESWTDLLKDFDMHSGATKQ